MTHRERGTSTANAWAPLTITLAIQAMVAMALLTLPAMAPKVAEAMATMPDAGPDIIFGRRQIQLSLGEAWLGALQASGDAFNELS